MKNINNIQGVNEIIKKIPEGERGQYRTDLNASLFSAEIITGKLTDSQIVTIANREYNNGTYKGEKPKDQLQNYIEGALNFAKGR